MIVIEHIHMWPMFYFVQYYFFFKLNIGVKNKHAIPTEPHYHHNTLHYNMHKQIERINACHSATW